MVNDMHATFAFTPGRWFDGQDNRPHDARARVMDDMLELELALPEPVLRRYRLASLRVGEHWPGRPLPVGLPDGGTLWLDEAGDTLAKRLAPRGWAQRLSAGWRGTLACLLVLVGLLAWFDRQGVGLMVKAALPLVPRSVDDAVGERVYHSLVGSWLTDSRIPEARQDEIDRRFQAVARAFPELTLKLEFRRTKQRGGGFNAFALPNGTLVLLDGLTKALDDDQLMAVLAHEAGHVRHRHGMQSVARSVGLLAVASVVMGDYSGVAATAAATVQSLHYSRDAEREADAEAQRLIATLGLPPDTLVRVWTRFAQEMDAHGGEMPAWLSTHPSMAERLDSARQAAGGASAPPR